MPHRLSNPPPSPPRTHTTQRLAVIDIGTNSVKLLVADVIADDVVPVLETSRQTRLGQGFYETHRLQPKPILDTARTAGEFAARARAEGAPIVRIIATSAARDAINAAELISAIEEAANATVEVISGEQEADWAFAGVVSDPRFAHAAVLILDIGGGSTEFILGEERRSLFRHSYKLGTVRTLEKHPIPDPPTAASLTAYRKHLDDFLGEHVEPQLGPALDRLDQRPVLVGTGGTASILSRVHLATDAFERDAIEAVKLTPEELTAHLELLWMIPLEQRRNVPGIPAERADVILPGIAILEAILRKFDLPEFQVSTRGLRFAALKP